MFRKLLTAAALGTALAAPVSVGATTITNTDGAIPFTGFDWAQNGTAFATGFLPVATDLFTMTYFAGAVALVDGIFNIPGATVPGLDTVQNGVDAGYEYTIVANINEQVISCVGTVCTFAVLGGTFDIYYDLAANANATGGALGTGFTDGVLIMSGTINPLASSTFDTVSGFNATSLTGVITTTNLTYVNPAFAQTTATTTLQLGNAITNWVSPGGFNGVAFNGTNFPIFQSDGNESFAAPEPASIALLGLGLLGLGAVRRRSMR